MFCFGKSWPKGIFCNGHVQVDAEKMSKSKGNFITLEGAIELWGSDATRFTCADAGDGVENANYDRVVADRTILNLTTELEWIGETLGGKNKDTKLREAEEDEAEDFLQQQYGNKLEQVAENEGVARGLFKGVSLNLLKNPIATAVSFTVNDLVKDFLKAKREKEVNRVETLDEGTDGSGSGRHRPLPW